jgi:hypothetical protein
MSWVVADVLVASIRGQRTVRNGLILIFKCIDL